MPDVSVLIRKLRKKARLTQAQFAKRIGFTPKSLGTWERGRVSPKTKIIQKIEKEFGVEILNSKIDLAEKVDMVSRAANGDKSADGLIWDMIYELMESDSEFRRALLANIRVFFRARQAEKNNEVLRHRIEMLEARLESVEKKLPP
jgi:transcriptional regulator with XRE-family HTH domain